MKIQDKTKLLFKIWLWTSIIINGWIVIIFEKNPFLFRDFCLCALMTICIIALAVIKIRRDILFNDFSTSGIVLQYIICIFIPSVIFIFHMFFKSMHTGAIVLMIATATEAFVVFAIVYRCIFLRRLKSLRSKKK